MVAGVDDAAELVEGVALADVGDGDEDGASVADVAADGLAATAGKEAEGEGAAGVAELEPQAVSPTSAAAPIAAAGKRFLTVMSFVSKCLEAVPRSGVSQRSVCSRRGPDVGGPVTGTPVASYHIHR